MKLLESHIHSWRIEPIFIRRDIDNVVHEISSEMICEKCGARFVVETFYHKQPIQPCDEVLR